MALWDFAEVVACDPSRAAALLAAPAPESIAELVLDRCAVALQAEQVRVGMEQAHANPSDLRVTLQFQVGETLADQFFNATTGYRAQFRHSWERGLEYNRRLIERLRGVVATIAPTFLAARLLSPDFADLGPMAVPREQVCDSLVPRLSKVWFCGRLITGDGRV